MRLFFRLFRPVPLGLSSLVLLFALGCGGRSAPPSGPTPIRIGYPTTALINGQIGQVFERTDVLKRHGLAATVTGFTYGAPLTEALAAGQIDVSLISEGPAAQVIAKKVPAKVIASLGEGDVRFGLLVRGDSALKTVADLKGKSVAVPFGSTPHLRLVHWIEEAGMKPEADVKLVNLGPGELEPALAAGNVDAIVYWEPNVSQIAERLGARVVIEGRYRVAVVMRREFLEAHRDAASRFLAAMREAALYMATHQQQVDAWFGEASQVDPALIHRASLYTPAYSQVKTLGEVDLGLTPAMLETLQQSADFYAQLQREAKPADMGKAVDLKLWEEAKGKVDAAGFDVGSIQVVKK